MAVTVFNWSTFGMPFALEPFVLAGWGISGTSPGSVEQAVVQDLPISEIYQNAQAWFFEYKAKLTVQISIGVT